MLNVIPDSPVHDGSDVPIALAGPSSWVIDEIVREGARRMLAEALQAEVAAYIARFADERDENGCRLVVRNGYHEPREVTTAAGAVQVHAPRVNDKRIDPETGVSGSGSRRRSCRRGRSRPRGWSRCCRSCTCTGCRPGISCPR